MKGLEKLTSVRLAEVLTQKNAIPTEAITDALYAQDKIGEPFVQVLVAGGHITEWDLAKIVVENFQLPFIMAGNYHISEAARDRVPRDVLFRNLLVPLDVIDSILLVAMPVLTPFEVMLKIQRDCKCDVFPYVGLISENKKVIGEMFKDFAEWQVDDQKRREADAKKAKEKEKDKPQKADDWASIFDEGEKAIQTGLKRPGPPAAGAGPAAAPGPAAPTKK